MKEAIGTAKEAMVTYGKLKISSQAVGEDGFILSQYTCSGANISPPLDIAGIPKATKSVAIIVDDPDALQPPRTLHNGVSGYPTTLIIKFI